MSYTTLKYHDPVKTDYVNRRFKHIRPIGIYRGGIITYSNPYDSIIISKFIAEISDTTGKDNQAKYYHSEDKPVSISGLVNPYIVLRWTHTFDENTDVPEFLAITNEAEITENDIIFCQINTVNKTVDYTKRTTPRGSDYNLKVQPSFTDSASVVEVMPGYVYVYPNSTPQQLTKTSLRINFTYFPISASVENYIYVTSAGVLMYATSKTALLDTNNTLLAVISKASGSDVINEKHITDYRSFVHLDANPDNLTLENNSTTGKIQIKEGGVTTAKLQTSTSTTTGVTSSKIADGAVIKGKILGGTGGDSAVDNSSIVVNASNKLQVGSGGITSSMIDSIFGSWTTKDSSNVTLAANQIYKSTSDGFISCIVTGSTHGAGSIYGYTGPSSGSVTIKIGNGSGYVDVHKSGFLLPVKKNEYWTIATTNMGTPIINWLPINSGVCQKV